MPIYSYQCKECDREYDEVKRKPISSDKDGTRSSCCNSATDRIFALPAQRKPYEVTVENFGGRNHIIDSPEVARNLERRFGLRTPETNELTTYEREQWLGEKRAKVSEARRTGKKPVIPNKPHKTEDLVTSEVKKKRAEIKARKDEAYKKAFVAGCKQTGFDPVRVGVK